MRKAPFSAQTLACRASKPFPRATYVVIVPREAPLSVVQLRNLTICAEVGAVVLPAAPGFYTKPQSLDDAINFIVGDRVIHDPGDDVALRSMLPCDSPAVPRHGRQSSYHK